MAGTATIKDEEEGVIVLVCEESDSVFGVGLADETRRGRLEGVSEGEEERTTEREDEDEVILVS